VSGPIRFVGGPVHNEIIFVNQWRPIIDIPVKPKIELAYSWKNCDSTPIMYQIAMYRLEQIMMSIGQRPAFKFFEYHHTEMDPNHAISSGGDGVCTHMRIR
jgi:hypothetical protein